MCGDTSTCCSRKGLGRRVGALIASKMHVKVLRLPMLGGWGHVGVSQGLPTGVPILEGPRVPAASCTSPTCTWETCSGSRNVSSPGAAVPSAVPLLSCAGPLCSNSHVSLGLLETSQRMPPRMRAAFFMTLRHWQLIIHPVINKHTPILLPLSHFQQMSSGLPAEILVYYSLRARVTLKSISPLPTHPSRSFRFQHCLVRPCTDDTSCVLCIVSTSAELSLMFGAKTTSRNARRDV